MKVEWSAYVKQYNRLETDMTAQLGALTTKFEQALGRLLIELTKKQQRDRSSISLQGDRDA